MSLWNIPRNQRTEVGMCSEWREEEVHELAKRLSGLLFPLRGHLQSRILEVLSTIGRYGSKCSVHQQAGKADVVCAHSGILFSPKGENLS